VLRKVNFDLSLMSSSWQIVEIKQTKIISVCIVYFIRRECICNLIPPLPVIAES
jgi:hypothetical protein